MIVAAQQPYFCPHPGFFHKARRADVLVLLDSVQFPRGTTWVSRNRFKNAQGTLWLTVPVWKKGLGLQRIDQVRICHDFPWAEKHLRSLAAAYARAPYCDEHLPFLERAFRARFERLVELNLTLIGYLAPRLGVAARLVRLSELGVQEAGSRLPVALCRRLGASVFLAQRSAKKYLDPDLFQHAGIRLEFFRPAVPVYPQLWGSFIANLSVFDLLFNCGPKAADILTTG